MALYEIRNLTFTYPKQEKPALSDLTFDVEEGEFLVICGKSGCGKSTLARRFQTAVSAYGKVEGKIFFDGRELSEVSIREQPSRIGFVSQNPDNQIVTDKVWHELAFGLENLGYEPDVIRLRVAEMASFFGIQNWYSKKVTELSGGQKQLLVLASIMAMQPDVLILDEPTSQLDPLAASDFLATLRKINVELGMTIILIEHRLEEVMSYADRLMVMENGKILALDHPSRMAQLLHGNDMFYAMPVPMRIFDALDGTGDCPVTVREGAAWLGRKIAEKDNQNTSKADSEAAEFGQSGLFRKRADKVKPVLEAKDVWFRYEQKGEDIVRDLNLSVMPGELFGILGGNGTGKTTTLSLLGRLLTPYRGKIFLKGKNLDSYGKELREGLLGVLPQNPQCLFVKDTLLEDLTEMVEEYPLRYLFLKKENRETHQKEIRNLVLNMAERMELTHLLSSHPYDLSGGEQQRAGLAKVLLKDPEILLLDEPTKGLDGFYKRKLAEILKGLTAEGKTIVMVSHDIEFCAEYADRCAMFFNGSVITTAPAKKFFRGNNFYTTTASRMARKWFPDAVTMEDVLASYRAID